MLDRKLIVPGAVLRGSKENRWLRRVLDVRGNTVHYETAYSCFTTIYGERCACSLDALRRWADCVVADPDSRLFDLAKMDEVIVQKRGIEHPAAMKILNILHSAERVWARLDGVLMQYVYVPSPQSNDALALQQSVASLIFRYTRLATLIVQADDLDAFEDFSDNEERAERVQALLQKIQMYESLIADHIEADVLNWARFPHAKRVV